MKKKSHLILAFFLPLQLLAIKIIAQYPEAVENIYSLQIFPVISRLERLLLGWIPISIGDLIYLSLGIVLIYWLYHRIKTRFKHPKKWILRLFSTCSILYFCFHFLWGINYYRLPLHKSLGIKADYSQKELLKLTEKLIKKSNTYQDSLALNDSTEVPFDFNFKKLKHISSESYESVAIKLSYLNYKTNSIKPSLFSLPLTYMGFSGYLNPLTNEAQINSKIPGFRKPVVMTHEMSHQLGFAKENEANFMGILATINSPNSYFKYSGYTFALQYCLSEIAKNDPDKARELLQNLHPGILKNFREVRRFWKIHKNPLEPVFKQFYGKYLKANNQPDGMKSYSYVVALLVNYFQDKNEL